MPNSLPRPQPGEPQPVPVTIKPPPRGKEQEPLPVTVATGGIPVSVAIAPIVLFGIPLSIWQSTGGTIAIIIVTYLQIRQLEATNEAMRSARHTANIVEKTTEVTDKKAAIREKKIDNIQKLGAENHAMLNSATLANLEDIEAMASAMSQMKPDQPELKRKQAVAKKRVEEHRKTIEALEAKIKKDKDEEARRKGGSKEDSDQ